MIDAAPQLAVELARFYLTLGLMAVGAGLMVAGPRGARRMGRLFFVDPLMWGGLCLRLLASTVLTGTCRLLLRLLVNMWALSVRFILWPVIDELRFWLRWLGGRSRR
jgi:hypothetical protein